MQPIYAFLEEDTMYNYLVFIDKIMSLHQDFKLALYSLFCSKWYDKANILNGNNPEISDKLHAIWEGNVPDFINYSNQYQEVLSQIYYIFVITGRFVQFKTFVNEEWNEMFEKHYTMGNFIKNLCEDNCIYFKTFLGEFVPKLSMYSSFNSAKRNIVFDMYVRLESYQNNSNTWYTQEDRLCMADRPEMFILNIRYFDIVTEFVNGPCQENQRKIFRYRTDIFSGLIYRIITDVDSHFYIYKEKTLDYILGLIEGEGELKSKENSDVFKVTKFMSNNFSAGKIYKLIHNLLKRLTISGKFKKDPKFKEEILAKVETNRNKKIEEIKLECAKEGKKYTDNPSYKRLMRLKAQDKMHSNFENKNSIITDEIMD